MQRQRAAALFRREMDVPARHGEAIRLAHRVADLDSHGHVQVAHEALHHHRLLRILLPEVRHVRGDHVEHLGHDRRHAIEVAASAVLSLQRLGQPTDGDRGREIRGIHLFGGRRKQVVDPDFLRQRAVARLIARVHGEVAPVVELRRVDEQPHDDDVALIAGLAHQRQVAVVKSTHGRDQADHEAGAAVLGDQRPQLVDCADRDHAAWGSLAWAASSWVAVTSASNNGSSSGAASATARR